MAAILSRGRWVKWPEGLSLSVDRGDVINAQPLLASGGLLYRSIARYLDWLFYKQRDTNAGNFT